MVPCCAVEFCSVFAVPEGNAFDPDCLMFDPTDGEHFLPLIQYHAELGPPGEAIFLIFNDRLALLHTVAGHRGNRPGLGEEWVFSTARKVNVGLRAPKGMIWAW